MTTASGGRGIAIIGIACRFPGADSPAEFWRNLRSGTESIRFFSDGELLAAGVDPAAVGDPEYVRASPILKDIDKFDAAFFGYSPKEAALMDPQHRLFLETCWEAFEDGGYDPQVGNDPVVGVFAGAGSALTSYLMAYSHHPAMQGQTAGLQHINNDKDFLSTRVSYKLDLTGPSINIQTACSTSLVAVHLACQSLLSGECDMALAGASTVRVPHISGYLARRGSVQSVDGHCRAFDAAGCGTIFGSGVAAVLLKPLEAALDERDFIYAVIKASAVNNDGASKISYTAASTTGQARAIVEALEAADVSADTIGYVECHATGTVEGDPVEIQALTRAFGLQTRRKNFCAVGSVKTNIGHPEQTAGLAGLIKTALSLKHGLIPPTVHFAAPNPRIPFGDSPFYVQSALGQWTSGETPRRAGVNSLGIGGTNAFVVLEESPEIGPRHIAEGRSAHVFCVSAKTRRALRSQIERFHKYLESGPDAELRDICHTASISRGRHQHRFAAVCSTKEELEAKFTRFLSAPDDSTPNEGGSARGSLAFLFSGQGTQYLGMSAELYRTVAHFRRTLDQCDALLRPLLDFPLCEILFGSARTADLNETQFTQPALFAVEYALTQLWRHWGVTPGAVMGHSLGEITAACVAGALDIREAIAFVAGRGALMQQMPRSGAMEVCFTDEASVTQALGVGDGRVSIAALNSPQNTVVAGERVAVEQLRERLQELGVLSTRLNVSHAFHSPLVEPILPGLEAAAARLGSRRPEITLISNVTGQTMQDAPLRSYWRDQARQTVRFADGMRTLRELGYATFVEVGPGETSLALGRQCLPESGSVWLGSMSKDGEMRTMLESLATLYVQGHPIEWRNVNEDVAPRRVPLPTYPFERKRFWIEEVSTDTGRPSPVGRERAAMSESPPEPIRELQPGGGPGLANSLYRISWQEHVRPGTRTSEEPGAYLVFGDKSGLGAATAEILRKRGEVCHLVVPSDCFASVGSASWTYDSARKADYDRLLATIGDRERTRFRTIIFFGALDMCSMRDMTLEGLSHAETECRNALYLIQALATSKRYAGCRLWLVTRGAQSVSTHPEPSEPPQALMWGLGRTVALEAPGLWGGVIDLPHDRLSAEEEVSDLVETILNPDNEQQVAIRRRTRYVPRIEAVTDAALAARSAHVVKDRTYLITGGLGMLGRNTAKWLVEEKGARFLVLVSRREPNADVQSELAKLEAIGTCVRVVSADVSNEADIRRVLEDIRRELPPLKGIVHSAGVLADGILTRLDWDRFMRATIPKIRGAWLLHQWTQTSDLDFFLVQSSLLSLTGSAGQANYTAANAFVDALVDYRRAQGLPATAINWGPWADAGMAAVDDRSETMWRARGISLIQPSLGMQALDRVIGSGLDRAAVVVCDWTRYIAQLVRPSPFYSNVSGSSGEPRRTNESSADTLRARLASAPRGTHRRVLVHALREQVARELGLDDNIDPRQPLQQFGVDSLMSVNLANRLETQLGIRVPVAKLVRGPSLEELAEDLLPELSLIGASSSPPASESSEPGRQPDSGPRSVTRGRGWLVFPRPNGDARLRLFCFNFAGGGAAPFRSWVGALAPWIELVAIEPPGRGGRINEVPLTRLDALLDGLIPEMIPYLDKPCAFFGHCLGGLTLFEVTRRLLRDGLSDLVQLFVSGSRPPQRVTASGRFEEDLLKRLLKDDTFDPIRPFHEQPDTAFANLLRQFNIWATDEVLAQPELRSLLLPAIRADFEIASNYRFVIEAPWNVPITCFTGLDDPYVTRRDAMQWNRHTNREFRIHLRNGNHFLVVEDRDFIVATINMELGLRTRAAEHIP